MFGLPSFLMNPEEEKRRRKRDREERVERAKTAVPWDPLMKWQPKLAIKAETWMTWDLFPLEPSKCINLNDETDASKIAVSPSGQFAFYRKVLPFGEALFTASGRKDGNVIFDGPVVISALHERSKYGRGDWEEAPWMSITPMETMSQRPGIRFAKGHTVVGGLGLGWFLGEVLKRKQVTKVTLVEKSQELVDWLLPVIKPKLVNLEKLEVVVGDAYEVIPKMTADAALIDIYRSYGGNNFLEDLEGYRFNHLSKEERRCAGIKVIWDWGRQFTDSSR